MCQTSFLLNPQQPSKGPATGQKAKKCLLINLKRISLLPSGLASKTVGPGLEAQTIAPGRLISFDSEAEKVHSLPGLLGTRDGLPLNVEDLLSYEPMQVFCYGVCCGPLMGGWF